MRAEASTNVTSPIVTQAVFQGGDILGGYRIESRIYSDGLADYYLCRQISTGILFTLKTVPFGLATEQAFQSRIRVEGILVQPLRHVNLLAIVDRIDGPQQTHLVMEWCGGQSLDAWHAAYRKKRGRPPVHEIRAILTQILRGLAYIHQAGLVHRNLKPTSILLKDNGEVKISGFSLVRTAEIKTSTDVPSKGGLDNLSSPSSDVYAFGCLSYFFFTGNKTPCASSQPASRVVRGLDPSWDKFIFTCLEDRPDKRYRDATEALNEFQAIPPDISGPWQHLKASAKQVIWWVGETIHGKPPEL